jgi:hypothetical protein
MNNMTIHNLDYKELDDFLPIIIPIFGFEGKISMPFDTISNRLAMLPTHVWRQPNKQLHGVKGIPQSRWSVQFKKMNCIGIECPLDKILAVFSKKQKTINEMIVENTIEKVYSYLRIYHTNKYPIMELTPDSIEKLNLVKASFTMDIFPVNLFEKLETPFIRQSWRTDKNGYNVWSIAKQNHCPVVLESVQNSEPGVET